MSLLGVDGGIEVACHQLHGNNHMMLVWHFVLTLKLGDLDCAAALNLLIGNILTHYWFSMGQNHLSRLHMSKIWASMAQTQLWRLKAVKRWLIILLTLFEGMCTINPIQFKRHPWYHWLPHQHLVYWALSMLVNGQRLVWFQRPHLVYRLELEVLIRIISLFPLLFLLLLQAYIV